MKYFKVRTVVTDRRVKGVGDSDRPADRQEGERGSQR